MGFQVASFQRRRRFRRLVTHVAFHINYDTLSNNGDLVLVSELITVVIIIKFVY